MKYLLPLLLCLCFKTSHAQAIYTHRTNRLYVEDGVIVVPDIGGKNHLWIITPGERVRLQVYNQQLDWEQQQILPLKLNSNSDVTILPFANEYFFYVQSQAHTSQFLWKIDNNGNSEDVSYKLKALIKSSFADSTVVCQMFNKGPEVFLIGNLYFPSLKKIVTTIIKTNQQLELLQVKRFAFAYNHREESLQRMMLTPANELLVLKQLHSDDYQQVLNVTKIDLNTARINTTSLQPGMPVIFPEMFYNPADSSTTLCGFRGRGYTPRLYFSTLDADLNQKLYATTIHVPISEEMYGAFACVSTGVGANMWLPVYGQWNSLYSFRAASRVFIGVSAMVTMAGNKLIVMNASSYHPKLQPIEPYAQNIAPPGDVRFSLVDLKSRNTKDTVIKYHRRAFIEVSQYAILTKNNNNFLVIKQKFRSNGKGVLLLNKSSDGKLTSLPLQLYEKFHYAIPQMQQTSKGSLIIPYVYKSEVGLVDVAFDVNQSINF